MVSKYFLGAVLVLGLASAAFAVKGVDLSTLGTVYVSSDLYPLLTVSAHWLLSDWSG